MNRLGAWILAAAFAAVVPVLTQAGVVTEVVHGRLAPTDDTSRTRGIFKLTSQARDNGDVREAIAVDCKRLDTTRDDQDALPDYHLFLTTLDNGTTADFGSFRLSRSGKGAFRWNTRTGTYPDGVESVTDFSAGVIEVRNGDSVVLTGTVPTFRSPTDSNSQGSHARGVRRAARRITAAEGYGAHGAVEARYANTPRGTWERVRVQLEGLASDGAPYTVVAIDGESNETVLGEVSPHGRRGVARLVIDTRDGDEIPGGNGVSGLSLQAIEVRDTNGTVVATGTFPRM